MSWRFLIALLLGSGLAACSKDKESETKLRRAGDQAAVVLVGGAEAPEGLVKEEEPNNESTQAQVLTLGAGATGSLEGSLDVDHYQIATTEEGLLFVSLDGAEDADLKLALQKADGSVLAKSDRGPAKTAEGIAGYWVEAKSDYLLVVSEFTKKKLRKAGGRTGSSSAYRLQVSLQASPEQDFEVEPNEDLEGAKEVGAGQEGHGYLGWAGDKDWWRIPVSGFGDVTTGAEFGAPAEARQAIDIVVSGMSKVATLMELTTASGEVVASSTSAPGKEVAYRSFIPDVGADFYILKLGSKRPNPEESYLVRVVAAELASGHEAEPNDSLEFATPVVSEVGVLSHASGELCLGDVDMFALQPAAMNRSMDLRLEGPADADLTVEVVAPSGAVLALSEKAGVGGAEMLVAVDVAPNTSPVVIVRAKKVLMPAAYKLSLSVSEGQGVAQVPQPPEPETPDLVE